MSGNLSLDDRIRIVLGVARRQITNPRRWLHVTRDRFRKSAARTVDSDGNVLCFQNVLGIDFGPIQIIISAVDDHDLFRQ
jgi:hypothetical protein